MAQVSRSDRLRELEVFARVVAEGGFSPAARTLGLTPSAVSKLVARLEQRLDSRLVMRSTRRTTITAEGAALHERTVRILQDLQEAEEIASGGGTPSGRVRISTSASYMTHVMAPLLAGLLAAYPRIQIEIDQTDRVVDLVADRTDIAIRAGGLDDSSLFSRALGSSPLCLVASPGYLARAGMPGSLAELAGHERLGFAYRRRVEGWSTSSKGDTIAAGGRLRISDGEGLRHLALAGIGVARLAAFTVRADMEAGRLVPLFPDLRTSEPEAFSAVYVGRGGILPIRVRAVIDYLARHGRVD
ncbi:LysR family transcriptional regulator [Mangrovibrevibacter kandeliae]|uniref:LysR family transcriptional regulator n=1 Tax=Mangrovibrevibacter kandeliae TaxID=2968473 RepID=UPI002740A1BE|nr:LysR family transcriptional regulator [Aurantimonas sp. CSK15Z-1]